MIMLELIEANLQKAPTLELMIARLNGYYQKSVFLFFLVHPTFYFAIFVALYLNIMNLYLIIILILKSFDIFFKIEIIRRRYILGEMERELEMMMGMSLSPWMSLLGVVIYIPLLLMALFG
jgi:hypothetical protein